MGQCEILPCIDYFIRLLLKSNVRRLHTQYREYFSLTDYYRHIFFSDISINQVLSPCTGSRHKVGCLSLNCHSTGGGGGLMTAPRSWHNTRASHNVTTHPFDWCVRVCACVPLCALGALWVWFVGNLAPRFVLFVFMTERGSGVLLARLSNHHSTPSNPSTPASRRLEANNISQYM